MRKAEVATIPAEKSVKAAEIKKVAGKNPQNPAGEKEAEKKNPQKQAGEKEAEKKNPQKPAGEKGAEKKNPQKPARTVIVGDEWTGMPEKKRTNDAGVTKKSAPRRAKAKRPNEKITPASIFAKMLKFGKSYQIEGEQDFLEAARIFADEAGLIDQMRDQIAEEGLTVMKTYKTGDVPVAHPLLSELPRHVESANKCLSTIGSMISERGAKKEKAARELDAFRLHAR